jgi:hypothetical protein
MNIRAAKFIQTLRGLSSVEIAIALNLAVHADFNTAIAFMSMTTLAAESGLQNRQTASLNVARLESYGIIRVVGKRSGGRVPTKYQFTFKVDRGSEITISPTATDGESNRNSGIAVETSNRNSGIAVEENPTATLNKPNRNSDGSKCRPTATQNAPTATGELHEGFKELQFKEERKAESTPKPSPPLFSKGGTEESSRPKIDLAVAEKLTDGIIAHAKGINKRASFSGKSKTDLKEAICKTITANGYASVEDLTRDLYEITQEKIHACDVFALRNFGSSLAAELIPSVAEKQRYRLRQEQAKADAEYEREKLESNRRFEEEKKQKEKQWFIDFELVRNGSTQELEAWINSYRYLPEYGDAADLLYTKVYNERAAAERAEKS